jgi:hypothetical protein
MSPEERQKIIAWSVATSCAIKTGEDPVVDYKRLMERFEKKTKEQNESNETF